MFSPCRTPLSQLKNDDISSPSLIQDLTSLYKLWVILNTLPVVSDVRNLIHNSDRDRVPKP